MTQIYGKTNAVPNETPNFSFSRRLPRPVCNNPYTNRPAALFPSHFPTGAFPKHPMPEPEAEKSNHAALFFRISLTTRDSFITFAVDFKSKT